MKQMKKWMAVLLTLVMTLAMGITAAAEETGNAEETYTITIQNEAEGHTYEAYQIFTGDLTKKDGEYVLSNIRWGSGVTKAGTSALGEADVKAKELEKKATEGEAAVAADFAKSVADYLNEAEAYKSSGWTSSQYQISGLPAGYYLVKDQDNSLDNADDFYTAYIMEVVGDVKAEPKGEKPTLNKQIKHNENDSWGVVGDNQIGDTVEFRTISTVPDTTGYTTYFYQITDTMSPGLTSNVKKDAQGKVTGVTIKVNDENGQGTELNSDYYTVTVDASNPNQFMIDVHILDAVEKNVLKKGDKLYAYYTGVLNEDAKIYDKGKQDNTAYLEYSNNPNDSEDKGKTPDKKVYDWTFKMGVSKVDEKNDSLTGATFVLSKNGNLKVADFECNDAGEPTVRNDLIGLVKDGNDYRVATMDDTEIVYTIEAGSPVIKGLDDAVDYYLYETKAPEHYNLLSAPVQFKIKAEYEPDGSAYKKVTATISNADGTEQPATDNLKIDVVNQPGANLPRTGGMGTTVFYAAGTLLVICAGVLLVVRKRMDKSGK